MTSMTARQSGFGILVATILFLFEAPAAEAIVTTFNADAEGWRITGDNASTWVATGGNPGGCFYVDDLATGDQNFAVAPPAYLGDWSAMTASSSSAPNSFTARRRFTSTTSACRVPLSRFWRRVSRKHSPRPVPGTGLSRTPAALPIPGAAAILAVTAR